MTDREKKANIEDKQRVYDEAKEKFQRYSQFADDAEKAARIAREHANKFAERQNAAARALNEARNQ